MNKLNIYLKFKTTLRSAWASSIRREEEGTEERGEEKQLKITSCGLYLTLRAFEHLALSKRMSEAVREAKKILPKLSEDDDENKFTVTISKERGGGEEEDAESSGGGVGNASERGGDTDTDVEEVTARGGIKQVKRSGSAGPSSSTKRSRK